MHSEIYLNSMALLAFYIDSVFFCLTIYCYSSSFELDLEYSGKGVFQIARCCYSPMIQGESERSYVMVKPDGVQRGLVISPYCVAVVVL